MKNPAMPGTNYFLVNLPNKYEFYFDIQKICTLVPEIKRYTIHNHNKTDSLVRYEKNKLIMKSENRINRNNKKKEDDDDKKIM
jgi:hypothetical protein